MKVLVDTSVWSLALRRPKNIPVVPEQQATINVLADLVRDGRAVLIGAIRQELPIFSLDGDFLMYRRWLPIHLYTP